MEKMKRFFEAVEAMRREHPEYRYGQTCFNVLFWGGLDPAFANEIRGGDLDPFHRDEVVPEFLEALQGRWREEGET